MGVLNSAEVIKGLYRTSEEDFVLLEVALTAFMVDVRKEFDADVLERCVLADGNWEIPVEERIVVMRRAKELGASSAAFLTDYYGFLSAHLDPGPEHAEAQRMLRAILLLDRYSGLE